MPHPYFCARNKEGLYILFFTADEIMMPFLVGVPCYVLSCIATIIVRCVTHLNVQNFTEPSGSFITEFEEYAFRRNLNCSDHSVSSGLTSSTIVRLR